MKTVLTLAFAGMAACGPMNEDNRAREAFKVLTSFATAGEGDDSEDAAPSPGLNRAAIEAQDIDLLRVSIISRQASALLGSAATNGTKRTWVSQDGLSLTFDGGLLVGSRGFGDDLMGSDATGAKASLRSGGSHMRTLDFLNGLDQIERRQFRCETRVTGSETLEIYERTYATTILEETCSGETGDFKNTYWRDSAGVIWQSRQWISDAVGYLGYQRL